MELIDTHCHLTVFEEDKLSEVMSAADKCGIKRMICIGASEGVLTASQAVALAERFSNVYATVGIHPHSAGNFTSFDQIEHLLSHPKVVAIGETGLDFFRDWAPKVKQYELFEYSIFKAKKLKKPLVIHCRDAKAETLEVLKRLCAEEVGGVFHCYAEDEIFAKNLWDLNFLVSFTGVLTFKTAHALRNTAKLIPLEQIMLETDCPYMAPEPFRGEKSEPKHVYQIALTLSEVKGVSLEDIALATSQNAQKLFGLP